MFNLIAAATVETSATWVVKLSGWVDRIDGYVWGLPLILTVLVAGIVVTAFLRMEHLFHLKRAFYYMVRTEKGLEATGEVSAFGALCTALSATIGTGSIVGVATAIGTGGPGALFWMMVAAFLGMGTKYAEGLLAVKYRTVDKDGKVLGGPFYYIEKGLGPKWKPLAVMFAVFGTLAALFGIGTITQIHGITSAVQQFFDAGFNPNDVSTGISLFGSTYSVSTVVAGAIVTVATALVLIGGLKRIATVSTFIVPFMAVTYLVMCLFIILGNLAHILWALQTIVRSAFNPAAATGGAIGSIFIAMQKGIARSIFATEAGLGSAPIAAAAARTNEPARQGLVCMMGTFFTIIICLMTGLTIVLAETWRPELNLEGANITIEAFANGLAFMPNSAYIARLFIMVSLGFFAFTTILGWNYYAERCLEYLLGKRKCTRSVIMAYRFLYIVIVAIGPYLTVSVVWGLADVFNGLMAFPNLIALILLSPVAWRTTKEFLAKCREREKWIEYD